jgi:hypothetical protein
MPSGVARAITYLLLAYWIVTALGILLTTAFGVLYPVPASQGPGVSMYDIPAYAMTMPYHPLLNLLVWPWFAWAYLRRFPAAAPCRREALSLALFWTLTTMVVDLIGWVLIRHPWSLTLREFYVDYQPWITLVYAVIFVSPLAAGRLIDVQSERRLRRARPTG